MVSDGFLSSTYTSTFENWLRTLPFPPLQSQVVALCGDCPEMKIVIFKSLVLALLTMMMMVEHKKEGDRRTQQVALSLYCDERLLQLIPISSSHSQHHHRPTHTPQIGAPGDQWWSCPQTSSHHYDEHLHLTINTFYPHHYLLKIISSLWWESSFYHRWQTANLSPC